MANRNHKYDQHFLRSPRVVAELIGHSNIRKNDMVLDLGAGSGIIASVLSRRCRQVIAIENEPNALKKLHDNLDTVANIKIIDADFLSYELPSDPYKVFSNIPFSLSAAVVRKLTSSMRPPKSVYLIVQRQFGMKLIMSDRHFSAQLGVEVAPWWSARIRKPLQRQDFTPPPAVDTVLLELKPREQSLLNIECRTEYCKFVANSFQNQRFFSSVPKNRIGISAEKKPSEITAQQWVQLYCECRDTGV